MAFITQYNTPEASKALSYDEFVEFSRPHRYPRRWLPKQYARLQEIQPEASADTVAVYEEEARLLAQDLLWIMQTNRRLKRELARVTEERDILKKATAYFARESQ